jgi:hypothetical protein
MHSYTVTSEIAGYDRKRRALRILFEAGFFAAFQIMFQVIWPDGAKLGHLWYLWYLGFGAIGGLIFALMFETVLAKLTFPYTLVVSDDGIITIHPIYERSVRKDELKGVAELNGNALPVDSEYQNTGHSEHGSGAVS